jgi:hypothetical protein
MRRETSRVDPTGRGQWARPQKRNATCREKADYIEGGTVVSSSESGDVLGGVLSSTHVPYGFGVPFSPTCECGEYLGMSFLFLG